MTITDLIEVPYKYVHVMSDNNFLHFIIKYPGPSLVCNKITLFPVQHNGTILHFAEGNNVAHCGYKILSI